MFQRFVLLSPSPTLYWKRLWGKEPIIKNEYPPSAPEIHMMQGKTQLPKLPSNLHWLVTVSHACAQAHKEIKSQGKTNTKISFPS